MSPHQSKLLPDRGYLIAGLGLSPTSHQALLDEAKARDYVSVFKDVGGKHDDDFREQSRVSALSAAVAELKRAVLEVTGCLEPAWEPTVLSFMRSTPGGKGQEAHQDYPEDVIAAAKRSRNCRVPASMIYALEEGTRLRVYDGCFSTKDEACARIVDIPVGFCVIFCGDLIHNGAAYDAVNYRIHCCLSYKGLKWEPDLVNSVLPRHLTCQLCGVKMIESNAMLQHRRYCAKNPKAAENKEKRRRSDAKTAPIIPMLLEEAKKQKTQ